MGLVGEPKTLAEARKNVKHYRALGMTDVWMGRNEIPWGDVTRYESGSAFRHNTPVSGWAYVNLGDGIEARYSFDIEVENSVGTGTLNLNVAAIRKAIAEARPTVRKSLVDHLDLAKKELTKEAEMYEAHASRLRQTLAFIAQCQGVES